MPTRTVDNVLSLISGDKGPIYKKADFEGVKSWVGENWPLLALTVPPSILLGYYLLGKGKDWLRSRNEEDEVTL